MEDRQEPKQLWIVVDDANNWLWYGRGTQADAVEGAKEATHYKPEAALYLYAVSAEIVIEPEYAKPVFLLPI